MDIMTIINEQALQLQQMRREMQEYEESICSLRLTTILPTNSLLGR